MNPNELRKQAKAALDAADAIELAAQQMGRSVDADEQAKIDELTTKAADLKGKAEAIEAKEAEAAQRREQRASLRSEIAADANRRPDPAGAVARINAPEARREFSNFGEFVQAVRYNPNDQRLDFQEFPEASAAETHTMGTGERGGFLVPEQFRSELLSVNPQEALFRPRATVIPAGSPPDAAVTLPALNQSSSTNMYGGVSVTWIGEGATKPQTDAKIREIRLEPKEVAAHVIVTDKLLRNAPAVSALVSRLLRGAIVAAEETAFISGSGSGKPLGVLNSGATITVNRTTVNTITYTNLVTMLSKMLMDGGSPVWLTNQTTIPQLMTIEDDNGNIIWQPNARDGMPQSLLGYPIFFNQRNPALGTAGDITLIDASKYLIKDGSGIFISAGHAGNDFIENKTRIKAFWNVDGQPWLSAPIVLEDGSTQVSPFVQLGDVAST